MTESSETEELLFMIKKIGLNLSARMELSLKNRDLTGVQVYFLVYILRHHPDGTYLTELYHEIGVSKATLSALIKKTEGKKLSLFSGRSGGYPEEKNSPLGKAPQGERRFSAGN